MSAVGAVSARTRSTGRRSPEWHQVYRAIEHGKARSACQQQGAVRAFPMEIRGFADTFIDLWKARQQGNYALEGEYSNRDVRVMIDTAVGAIDQLEQADVRHRRSFVVHVLFKPRQL